MADQVDVLLEYWKEQRAQARHTEVQRAVLTNLILLIVAASLGFIAQQGLRRTALAVSILLILLGIFGVMTTVKYYERYNHHIEQAKEFSLQIARLYPGCDHEAILAPVRARSDAKIGRFGLLRLYRLWIALHFLVALIGFTLTIVILA
jgi:hypothetical protein